MNDIHKLLDKINNVYNTKITITKIITLSKKIKYAYDFDGVLHKNVGPMDEEGQRHPDPQKFNMPFIKIINQINEQIKNGHDVYIITAHCEQNYIINFLKFHGILIPVDHINTTCKTDKTNTLRKIGINEFYDDSCLRIIEIYINKNKGLLPNLNKLYLVNPESDSWIEILKNKNNQTIMAECGKYYKTS